MTSQLVKWYAKNKSDKFELVLVNFDRSEKDMLKYLKSKKVNFPAMNFKDRGMKSVQSHATKFIPCISLVGEDGKTIKKDISIPELEKKLGIK